MPEKITIGKWEAVCLLLNTINIQIFLNLPRYVMEVGGTAGWILSIYITILVLLIFSVVLVLFKRFPGKDIVGIGDTVAGKIGRITVGLIFTLLSFSATALVLREFSENVKIIALPSSPLSYIMSFFIIGFVIAGFLGFENIIRINGFLIPVITAGFLAIILLVSPLIEFNNIFPIMGNGFMSVFGEGFLKISLFIGISMIYWFPPFLKTFERFRTVSYWSLALSGIFILLSVFVYSAVIEYPAAVESIMPIYTLSRLIEFGRFLERIEPLFLIIWSLSAFLYTSACLFCAIYGFKRAFNLPFTKPLVIPFSILAFNVAFLPEDIMSTIELDRLYFRTLGFLPVFGVPILLLLIAWFRKKGEVHKAK